MPALLSLFKLRKTPKKVKIRLNNGQKDYTDCVFIVDEKRAFNNSNSNGSSYTITIKKKELNIEYPEYDKPDYKFSYLVDKTNVPNIENLVKTNKVETLYDMHECIIKKYLNTPNIVVTYGHAKYSPSNGKCYANYNNANTRKHSNSRESKKRNLTFQSSLSTSRRRKRISIYGFPSSN